MSRIIRCPSCVAVFKIEVQQLQAAYGWLRCGKCLETFNGAGLDVPAPSAPFFRDAEDVALPSGEAISEKSTPRVDLEDLLLQEDRSSIEPISAHGASAELMAFSDALATFKPDVRHLDSAVRPDMDKAKVPSRFFLYASMVFTGFLLLGQLFLIQRHVIAALWPQNRIVLQHLCRPFNCEVKPLLDPQAIVMEGDSFEQSGDVYVLSWSLRNTRPIEVGTTSLELSLLDEFNNPIVRRVFSSTEMKAPAVLAPGQVWSGSLPLLVDRGIVFSQYRLLSFYP